MLLKKINYWKIPPSASVVQCSDIFIMIYDSISHQYFRGRRISLISSSHACTIINLWQISITLIYHNSCTFIKLSHHPVLVSPCVCVCHSWNLNSNIIYHFSYVELVQTTVYFKSLRVQPTLLNSTVIISLTFHGRHRWPKSTSSAFIPYDISAYGTVNHQIIISKLSNLGITPVLVLFRKTINE